MDTGRAKLFGAAVARSAIDKPESQAFTRRRYYHEIKHRIRTRWEAQRMANNKDARDAITTLSETGGMHNCDPESWRRYLLASKQHFETLRREFLEPIDRALWRMRAFRLKWSSIDRSVGRLLKSATDGVSKSRPLVIGVGAAGFAPTGKGELAVPTSELIKALRRAISRVRRTGRKVVVVTPDERYTTMKCCACGAITDNVIRGIDDREKRSRRLRRCTSCDHAGKLRDRDVQASRNILWLLMAKYYGLERPDRLSQGDESLDGTVVSFGDLSITTQGCPF